MDIRRIRQLLKDTSRYGWEKFQQAHSKADINRSRDIMPVAYMSQAQVHFEAVISLTMPLKAQSMAAIHHARALQEYYVDIKLMTLRDDDTFANYLYINSEYENITTAGILLRLGEITQIEHDNIVNETNKLIDTLKLATTLPTIQRLISADKDYYGKSQFSLKKKCEIIDALDITNTSVHKMVDNYDAIYKHLSGHVHPDARTILKNIDYNDRSSMININGDGALYENVIVLAYMYYTAILEMFVSKFDIYEHRRFRLFQTRFHKYIPSVPEL